jgi:hypothetical protein
MALKGAHRRHEQELAPQLERRMGLIVIGMAH